MRVFENPHPEFNAELAGHDLQVRNVPTPGPAKSSRSAGVAIMTPCELPLYVNAIAASSGMSRWPSTNWSTREAVRDRHATEVGTLISAHDPKPSWRVKMMDLVICGLCSALI